MRSRDSDINLPFSKVLSIRSMLLGPSTTVQLGWNFINWPAQLLTDGWCPPSLTYLALSPISDSKWTRFQEYCDNQGRQSQAPGSFPARACQDLRHWWFGLLYYLRHSCDSVLSVPVISSPMGMEGPELAHTASPQSIWSNWTGTKIQLASFCKRMSCQSETLLSGP